MYFSTLTGGGRPDVYVYLYQEESQVVGWGESQAIARLTRHRALPTYGCPDVRLHMHLYEIITQDARMKETFHDDLRANVSYCQCIILSNEAGIYC